MESNFTAILDTYLTLIETYLLARLTLFVYLFVAITENRREENVLFTYLVIFSWRETMLFTVTVSFNCITSPARIDSTTAAVVPSSCSSKLCNGRKELKSIFIY